MAEARPPQALLAAIRMIDRFTDRAGTIVSWLAIPLVGAVAYRAVARHVPGAPAFGAYEATCMLYGALFMLGAAYALHKRAHIRTDFFWDAFSPRIKGAIDSIAYVLLFFPSVVALGVVGYNEASHALLVDEIAGQPPPVLWPLKLIVPVACALLIVQGLSELLKSVYMARTGIELEPKEKVEV